MRAGSVLELTQNMNQLGKTGAPVVLTPFAEGTLRSRSNQEMAILGGGMGGRGISKGRAIFW